MEARATSGPNLFFDFNSSLKSIRGTPLVELGRSAMQTLREKLADPTRFLVATELVSVRGSMAGASAIKARDFANELVASLAIDWISITDNAGGNPQLAPLVLGRPILYAGKEVVIHLTCKDLNRNGLESEAWMLNSEGFHNILAMTGDYPVTGSGGQARPVFDIDFIGLISLLARMNQGLNRHVAGGAEERLEMTQFCVGAVTTNFKLHEGEVIPQYMKLAKKVECGAQFIINQIGFDSRKISELRCYMDAHGMKKTPLIGNVYLLSPRVAQLFHAGRIPGVVVSYALWELCRERSAAPDRGKAFFLELAAKQIAVYRGLGFRGVYLGGVHNYGAIEKILEIERGFALDDWKQFAREIRFSRPGEFFFYAENPATGLADATRETPRPRRHSKHVTAVYQASRLSHFPASGRRKPSCPSAGGFRRSTSESRLLIMETPVPIPRATNHRHIWLRVGTLLDGGSAPHMRNAHLVYSGGGILFVGQDSPPRSVLNDEQKQPDADLPDYTLLPGLIDAHTHFFLEGGELDPEKRAAHLAQPPEKLLHLAGQRLEKLVRLGIAACRDAGDKDGVGLALSNICAAADRPTTP